MRALFWLGVAGLVLFELALVWLVMPLPGSQRLATVDLAYALHQWRWVARALLVGLVLAALPAAWRARRWGRVRVVAALLLVAGVAFTTNVTMAADRIFLAPTALRMRPASANEVEPERLVVGIEIDGEARAYPVRFLGYHHQVRDTVAGRPVLVTYCTVCRTGRVFDPTVDGAVETFRLVGMDHWNAMLEDRTTGSWWRQANGEAIAGPRAGARLAELPSRQTTLATWLAMHPRSLVMQADSALSEQYAEGFDYETGKSRKTLTGTDTVSWGEKAWVVGIVANGEARAYDWNRLTREKVVNDTLGGAPIVLALAADGASFVAYRRPDASARFTMRGDSLVSSTAAYDFGGRGAMGTLAPVAASQEFWHSWRTFQPRTSRY